MCEIKQSCSQACSYRTIANHHPTRNEQRNSINAPLLMKNQRGFVVFAQRRKCHSGFQHCHQPSKGGLANGQTIFLWFLCSWGFLGCSVATGSLPSNVRTDLRGEMFGTSSVCFEYFHGGVTPVLQKYGVSVS